MNIKSPFHEPKPPLIDQVLDTDVFFAYFSQLIKQPEKLAVEVQNGNMVQSGLGITQDQMAQLYTLGHQYFESGDYENALQHFICLALFDNREPAYLFSFANTSYILGDYENALEAFQGCARLEELNPRPLFHIAHCHAMMGHAQEALEAYDLAIDLAQKDHAYHEIEEEAIKEREELRASVNA